MSDLKKMTEDEFSDLINELDYDGCDAFVEMDFSNYDLTELDFQRIINKFVRCNFSGSDMTGVNMYEVEFFNCDFTNAKLDKVRGRKSQTMNCSFNGASMIGADFTEAKIYCTNFDSANLSSANFTQADLRVSAFFDANLTNTVFDDTLVRSTIFRNSDVSGVDFRLTMLNGYSLNALTEAKNLDLTSRFDVTSTSGGCEKIISSGE